MQLTNIVFVTTAAFASAQVVFNTTSATFTCPATGGNFCPGPSLSINIIVRCNGILGQPGNCNDNLAGVPPGGLKFNALCYQSATTAGDAACSLEGIVYPDTGSPFPIPAKTNATSAGATSTNNLSSTPSAVTSTKHIPPAALMSPVAALATLGVPYPIAPMSNNGTGIGGVVLGTGSGPNAVLKPTIVSFTSGSGKIETGFLMIGAWIFVAAALP